jgi:enoyl-CoA hydratase
VDRYESFEFFRFEHLDRILVATLNRPEKLNAVRHSDHRELGELLRTVAKDDDTDILVLHGAGRAFCIGGDYELIERGTKDPRFVLEMQRDARELVQAHIDLEKPVIAAIHGRASGSGATFALLSDIIIAERGALIGDCHTRFAMAAGDGGVLTWPLSMGIVRAKRYLLTGDWLEAEEAERLGLITEVVEEGQGRARAIEWAERLSENNADAVRLTKRAINGWLALGMTTAFNASVAFEMLTFMQPELAETAVGSLRPPSRRNVAEDASIDGVGVHGAAG